MMVGYMVCDGRVCGGRVCADRVWRHKPFPYVRQTLIKSNFNPTHTCSRGWCVLLQVMDISTSVRGISPPIHGSVVQADHSCL